MGNRTRTGRPLKTTQEGQRPPPPEAHHTLHTDTQLAPQHQLDRAQFAWFNWCFGYGTSEVLLLLLLVGGVCWCGDACGVVLCAVSKAGKHEQTSHDGACGRTWVCGAGWARRRFFYYYGKWGNFVNFALPTSRGPIFTFLI
jgi:hypothetical protein